ncbi:MAG: 2-polyprenyl-3-methyl-6-methoxy-1,4-benzoquinone monooxygenase [Hydrogenophilales bacterium]|nr:2-polyprenyl-3-methyl-6-methoxy-1,4-benzoquinone monooxygenase [Hydrogenophilales bacterium]
MLDRLIVEFDKGLRTLFASAATVRPLPSKQVGEATLSEQEKRVSAALMRVNHSGEICAQALYQGQALTARNPAAKAALDQAAQEETEHLSWCETRIRELGSHTSYLNPLLYTGSLAIGAFAGVLGDKWNLGFLAETEHQVEAHLARHLERLPAQDAKSRAIVEQMKQDEARHATTALEHGGAELPLPVKLGMKLSSKLMTKTAYWV